MQDMFIRLFLVNTCLMGLTFWQQGFLALDNPNCSWMHHQEKLKMLSAGNFSRSISGFYIYVFKL